MAADILSFIIEVGSEKAEASVARFSDKLEHMGKTGETAAQKTAGEMAKAGAVLVGVGAAIGAALGAMVEHTAELGDTLHDMAMRTGMTAEQLSVLRYAAEQSGASIDTIATGIRFLSRNMIEAASGGKDQTAAFAALGIQIKDTEGKIRPMNDVFLDVADRFSRMQDGAGKTALAIQLFGRGGTELIPVLNEGSAGIQKMGIELGKVGGIMSTETASAADRYKDSQNLLAKAVEGFSITVGSQLIPALTHIVQSVTPVLTSIQQWTQAHPELIRLTAALVVTLIGSGGLLAALAAAKVAVPLLSSGLKLLGGAGGTLFLTGAAFAALLAVIYTFRNEISSGLLKSLSLAVEGISFLVGIASVAAEAFGLDGLGGRLQEASKQMINTSSSLTEMAYSFEQESGVVIDNTKAVKDWMESQKQVPPILDDTAEKAEKATKKLEELRVNAIQKLGQELPALLNINSYRIDELTKDYQASLKQRTKDLNDAIDRNNDNLMKTAGARSKDYDDAIKDGEKWSKANADQYEDMLRRRKQADLDAVESVKKSAGQIFDAMLIKGENVFMSLGNMLKGGVLSLGRAIFQDVTGALLGPVKKAFDDFFQETVKKLITDALSGAGAWISRTVGGALGIGGAAAGGAGAAAAGGAGAAAGAAGAAAGAAGAAAGAAGAAAGAAGAAGAGGAGGAGAAAGAGGGSGMGSLGAFFTNPWTIAIGAAIAGALALHHWVGQGRKVANQFVKEFQNPFGDAIGNIVDAVNLAAAAGKLTAEQATLAEESVIDLWTSFKTQAREFAKQGENEATVVRQAFETLNPIMDKILSDLHDKTVELADAEKMAGTSTNNLTDGLNTAGASTNNLTDGLNNFTDTANMAVTPITDLIAAISELASSATTAAGKIISAAAAISGIRITAPTTVSGGGSSSSSGGGSATTTAGSTTTTGFRTIAGFPNSTGIFQHTPFGVRSVTEQYARSGAPGVYIEQHTPYGTRQVPWAGSFAMGGPVKRTGLALVHAGEYVVPTGDSAGGAFIGDVTIDLGGVVLERRRGESDDEAVEGLIRALSLNKQKIRDKIREALREPSSPRLIAK